MQESKRFKSRSVSDFADEDDRDKPQQSHMTILDIEADEDVRWWRHTDGILDVLEARERSRHWPSREEVESAVAEAEQDQPSPAERTTGKG